LRYLYAMSSRPQLHSTSQVRAWRFVLVLLALLATGAQQLVAQTHWHAASTQAGAVVSDATTPDGGAATDHDCLLCQIAAHAAAVAPPPVLQQLVLLDRFEVQGPVVQHLVVIPSPAHAWQSRGPPAI
jgi:hypothetical protein